MSTASLGMASANPVFLRRATERTRLGDDVLPVLDALNLKKPVLVGHSLGGEELSSVATRYPSRVAAQVYLEAAYPHAFDNGKGSTEAYAKFSAAERRSRFGQFCCISAGIQASPRIH